VIDRLKMFWSHARWRSTEVIELETFRDRADEQFVSDTVGTTDALPDAESTVTARLFCGRP